MLSPEKVIVYRSEGEAQMDHLLYGGGLFESGFITNYIITDILLVVAVTGVIIVVSTRFRKRRR